MSEHKQKFKMRQKPKKMGAVQLIICKYFEFSLKICVARYTERPGRAEYPTKGKAQKAAKSERKSAPGEI